MRQHRSNDSVSVVGSAPKPADSARELVTSASSLATAGTITTALDVSVAVDRVAGATGVAGGLHLYFPDNEAPIAVDDGGWDARPFTDKDLWRLSAIVCKLLDASRLAISPHSGALSILFRNPDDADFVVQHLADMRRGM
jgi:hypothetical protein